MRIVKKLLRDRNVIMLLGIAVGLAWGDGAAWTEPLTLPGLAMVMTLSTIGISGSLFRPISSIVTPGLAGIAMSYLVFAGVTLTLSLLLVGDPALRTGFVLLAAVPPAVAVIPFTLFLKGNTTFSLMGTIGGYLGGLVIMPLITLIFIGAGFLSPFKVILILVELILAPLFASRILMWLRLNRYLEPVKGTIINWTFCVFTYTVVGLNRDIFLHRPGSLLVVAAIAVTSLFVLGWAIERVGRLMGLSDEVITSLVLLGTLKNYGIAGGIALALFSREAAMPSTISAIVMILYIVWLEYRKRWALANTKLPSFI
jgi:BASS family bile acid:Na+ symporter